jgi:hypothetical protein
LGVDAGVLMQVETADAGLLRLSRPETLAILLDQLEMPRSSLATAITAAAQGVASPLRGGAPEVLDARAKERLDRLMDDVADALLDRDRSDLVD